MHLEIISPENQIFSDSVKLVQVPGTQSPFTILKNHTAIISTIQKGQVRVVDETDKTFLFDVKGGIVEVLNNNIIILAD
ncbi:MAG: ATP synthase F1 subunit epsilon [Bacteroidales bacterium]|nr:ATP synthase F1 subunit epsilon [Bacteroidales bacterium]